MLERVCLPSRTVATLLHNDPEACLEHVILHPEALDWGWIQFEGPLAAQGGSTTTWLGISWDASNHEKRGNRTTGTWLDGRHLFDSISGDVSFVRADKIPPWGRRGASFLEVVALKYLARNSSYQCAAGLKHVPQSVVYAQVTNPSDLPRQESEVPSQPSTTESVRETSRTEYNVPMLSSLWDIPPGAKVEQEYRLVGFEDHIANYLVPSKLLKIPSLTLPHSIIKRALPENFEDTALPLKDKASIVEFLSLCEQNISPSSSSEVQPIPQPISLFANLESLDLSHNFHLDDIRALYDIINLCPHLRTLILNDNPQLFTQRKDHCNVAPRMKCSIQHLSLANSFAQSPDKTALSSLTHLIRNLINPQAGNITLVLSDNHLSQDDVEDLMQGLLDSKLPEDETSSDLRITHLELSNNQVKDIRRLVQTCSWIERLNVSYNPLTWTDLSIPTQPMDHLKALNVDGCGITSWTAFYWLCLLAPNLEEMRCAKNPFLQKSSRQTENWVRDRYKRWAFFSRLKSMDGELLTPMMKVEAERYTASLLERGLDFKEVVDCTSDDAAVTDAAIIRPLLERLYTLLNRDLESTISRLRDARLNDESILRDLQLWIPNAISNKVPQLSEPFKMAMATRLHLASVVLHIPRNIKTQEKQDSSKDAVDLTNHVKAPCENSDDDWMILEMKVAPTLTTVEDLKIVAAARTGNWNLMEQGALLRPLRDARTTSERRAKCNCPLKTVRITDTIPMEPDIHTLDHFGLIGSQEDAVYDVFISSYQDRHAYNASSIYSENARLTGF